MEIIERKMGSVTVIDLKGEVKARGQHNGFQQLVHELMEEGQKKFIINLSECRWIDSAGLGELIRSFAHVMRQGGSLKLACAPEKIRNILNITNLTEVIELYDTEEAALRSFEL